jgi:hypothetical protein
MGQRPPSESSESEANAAFIVLACNNHERLVSALKKLDVLLDFGNEEVGMTWEFEDTTAIQAAFAEARAALAALKELTSG